MWSLFLMHDSHVLFGQVSIGDILQGAAGCLIKDRQPKERLTSGLQLQNDSETRCPK